MNERESGCATWLRVPLPVPVAVLFTTQNNRFISPGHRYNAAVKPDSLHDNIAFVL